MANNRMFIVNKRTGQSVGIAKYFPSTGWVIRDSGDGLKARLLAMFEQDQHQSSIGSVDYEIEYEEIADEFPINSATRQ